MKKSLLFLCFLLLSLIYISAQITITPTSDTSADEPQQIINESEQQNQENTNEPTFLSSEEKQDPKAIVQNATGAAKNAAQQGIKTYDESVALQVPPFLEKPTQFLFHTNGETISLNIFLTLIILFCMLFMILNDIVKEIFDSKLIHYGIAFLLTVIASLSGTLYNVTLTIANLSKAFTSEKSVILETTIVFVILILLFLLFKYGIRFVHSIRQENKTEEASRKGMEFGNVIDSAIRRRQNAQKN